MPEILAVNPSGLFSYALHDTISLDSQGVVQLTGINHDRLAGDANGAGKTSILNSACFILYGECPIDKVTDTSIVNQVWNKGCWGMLQFRGKNGDRYRMVMSRKWKGAYPDPGAEAEPCQLHEQGSRLDGTDIYLDVWNGGKWIDLRRAKTADTRAYAIEQFGLSYRQFLTTSYLAQQTGSLLVTGKNKDRMQIITELTDMSIWDRAVTALREKMRDKQKQVDNLHGQMQGLEIARRQLPAILDETRITQIYADIAANEAKISEYRTQIQEVETQRAEMLKIQQDYQIQVDGLRQKQHKVGVEAGQLSGQQLTLGGRKMTLAQTIPMADHTDSARQARADASAQISLITKRLSMLRTQGGECDSCGQPVTSEQLQEKRIELATELQRAQRAQMDAVAEVDRLLAIAKQEHSQKVIAAQAEIDADLEKLTEQNEVLRQEWDSYETQIKDLQGRMQAAQEYSLRFNSALQVANNGIASHQNFIANLRLALTMNEQVANQHKELNRKESQITDSLVELEHTIQVLNTCVKGMGDKGIKAHKFGTIIAILNELIKEYIAILTDNQVQVWLSPFREKASAKSADDVVAEISIMVKEGPKEGIDLALYSGAEKQQATLAIICAFWRLATLQSGGTNVLFLDEIFGCFGRGSSDRVLSLLSKFREVQNGTVVVVTHSDYVKEMLPHDQLWIAEKKNHITKLVRRKA